MSQTATIRSLPQAFEIIKEMRAEGYEWGEDYCSAVRGIEPGPVYAKARELYFTFARECRRRGGP